MDDEMKAEHAQVMADAEWWQQAAPPGWRLSGWTNRKSAGFMHETDPHAYLSMDGVAAKHIHDLRDALEDVTASLDNTLLHLGDQMTEGDQQGRRHVVEKAIEILRRAGSKSAVVR